MMLHGHPGTHECSNSSHHHKSRNRNHAPAFGFSHRARIMSAANPLTLIPREDGCDPRISVQPNIGHDGERPVCTQLPIVAANPELHHPRACLRTRRRTRGAGLPTAQFLSFGETSKSRPSSESRPRFRCIYRNFQDEAVILKEMREEKRRSIVCVSLPLGGAMNQPIQYQDSICPISVFDAEQSESCPWMSRAGVRATFRLSPLFSCNGSRFLGDHMTQTSFGDAFHITESHWS